MRLTPGLKLLVAVGLNPLAENRKHNQIISRNTRPLDFAPPQTLPKPLL
jgi:hypothetical protein